MVSISSPGEKKGGRRGGNGAVVSIISPGEKKGWYEGRQWGCGVNNLTKYARRPAEHLLPAFHFQIVSEDFVLRMQQQLMKLHLLQFRSR